MPPKKTAATGSSASQNQPVAGSSVGPTPARVRGVADHLYRRDEELFYEYNQAVEEARARFRVERAHLMGTPTEQAEMHLYVERRTYNHTLARIKARGKVESPYTRNRLTLHQKRSTEQ